MVNLVYNRHYNIGFVGFERLHPFDSRKYGRVWKELKAEFGRRLNKIAVSPRRAVRRDELLLAYSPAYLEALRNAKYLAGALEMPLLARLPWRLIDWHVLRPMRWATMGTVVAAREALRSGFTVNLSGGYHHAKPAGGEGFCIYADVAIAVMMLRREKLLADDARVAHIDLDAHQGNGVCHCFQEDRRFFIFDMYNSQIYPAYDRKARDRIDCNLPLPNGCTGTEYLRTLKSQLPPFLDSISRTLPLGLVVYNAGSDVYEGDTLGGLRLSFEAVIERDAFVVEECRRRELPVLMLLSGGYSRLSYRLVAESLKGLLRGARDV
jgi:histone deacetylase 11